MAAVVTPASKARASARRQKPFLYPNATGTRTGGADYFEHRHRHGHHLKTHQKQHRKRTL